MVKNVDFVNLGPIRSMPLGRAEVVHAHGHDYAVFRDTYGHCYVIDCAVTKSIGEDFKQGVLDGRKVRFKDGKALDLQTGAMEGVDKLKVKIVNSWVENGFVLMSIMEVINSTGLM